LQQVADGTDGRSLEALEAALQKFDEHEPAPASGEQVNE
jgi:hypothetical protein